MGSANFPPFFFAQPQPRLLSTLEFLEFALYLKEIMDAEFLRTVSILRQLNTSELESFSSLLTLNEVKPRQRLTEEGTPVVSLSIICTGVVHIRRLAQKREMLLGRLGPGGFFGEINLFDPGLATASIYAMKPSTIASVPYDSLRAYWKEHPDTGYKVVSAMMTEMCRRFRLTSDRLVNLAYWDRSDASLPPEA